MRGRTATAPPSKTKLDIPFGTGTDEGWTVDSSKTSKTGKGVVANRYHPGDEVGKGAFSRVFGGLDFGTGSVVAIKQVEKPGMKEKEHTRVVQELGQMRRLDHPNIVKLLDFEETADVYSFILEFIEGGSLQSHQATYGNLPEPLLARFISQSLHGLQYLHNHSIQHRDLQGENILVSKSGDCKLSAFGSCSNALRDDPTGALASSFWLAPEILSRIQGGGGSAERWLTGSLASDIWSIGCTILELFTGAPPYKDLGQGVAALRMVQDPHPPLPEDLPKLFKEFLLCCFLKDEKSRYTATELLDHAWFGEHSSVISGRLVPGGQKDALQPPPLSQPLSYLLCQEPPALHLFNRAQLHHFPTGESEDGEIVGEIKGGQNPKKKQTDIEMTVLNWAGGGANVAPPQKRKGKKARGKEKGGREEEMGGRAFSPGPSSPKTPSTRLPSSPKSARSPPSSPLLVSAGIPGNTRALSPASVISPKSNHKRVPSYGQYRSVSPPFLPSPRSFESQIPDKETPFSSSASSTSSSPSPPPSPSHSSFGASHRGAPIEETEIRVGMSLKQIEETIASSVDLEDDELLDWATKVNDLVKRKVDLEVQCNMHRKESQALFRKKEELEAKRDFVKNCTSRQKNAVDMTEHEIRGLLRRLEETGESQSLESESGAVVSMRWMMPGATCQARSSITHKMEDAVITSVDRVNQDLSLYSVVFIGSGNQEQLKANQISPPQSHWLPEELRKKKNRAFWKKDKN